MFYPLSLKRVWQWISSWSSPNQFFSWPRWPTCESPRGFAPWCLEFARASLVLVVQQSHSCFLASGTLCPCRWRGNICLSGCYLIFSYVRNNCLTDYELSPSSTLSGMSVQLNVNDSNEISPSTSRLSVRINYAGELQVGVLILCCVLPVFTQAKHGCKWNSWRTAGVFSTEAQTLCLVTVLS